MSHKKKFFIKHIRSFIELVRFKKPPHPWLLRRHSSSPQQKWRSRLKSGFRNVKLNRTRVGYKFEKRKTYVRVNIIIIGKIHASLPDGLAMTTQISRTKSAFEA